MFQRIIMGRQWVLSSLLLILVAMSGCSSYRMVDPQQFSNPIETRIHISNITMLSQDGKSMLPNQHIVIENGIITRITSDDVSLPGATLLDGKGRYLIPGLVESHGHLKNSPNDLLVYVAHGVTYVRDMSGKPHHKVWQKEIEQGRPGPKLFIARGSISSKTGFEGLYRRFIKNSINVTTESEAEEVIKKLKAEGYEAGKVWSLINKSMYLAVNSAATKHGFNIVGHIPDSVLLEDFWQSGQKEVAHIEEISKALAREMGGFDHSNANDFLDLVRARSAGIARRMKDLGIAVHTTLWFMNTILNQTVDLENTIAKLDLSLGDPQEVATWMPGENPFEVDPKLKTSPEHLRQIATFWDAYVDAIHILLKDMVEHDVVILAGSDPMAPLTIPGISMHDELASLVKAGMTPAQALRAATVVPGEWMNSNTGKIKVGYIADLVLLDKNPLQDIHHTRDIHAVIIDGRIYDNPRQMLQTVRDAYVR